MCRWDFDEHMNVVARQCTMTMVTPISAQTCLMISRTRRRTCLGTEISVQVLHGEVRLRVREIIKQVCAEMGVTIVNGALSRDHVHMFVEIPPHIAVSDFVRRVKRPLVTQNPAGVRAYPQNAIGVSASGPGATSPPPAGNITNDIIMIISIGTPTHQ